MIDAFIIKRGVPRTLLNEYERTQRHPANRSLIYAVYYVKLLTLGTKQ